MHTVLLKLHAAKIMDIGSMAFHLFEHKLDLRLRDDLLFVYADDSRFLAKFAGVAAPARPDAEPKIIDRQRGRRDHAQRADKSLHSIDFTTNVLTNYRALQVWKNNVRFHLADHIIPRINSVNNARPSTIR